MRIVDFILSHSLQISWYAMGCFVTMLILIYLPGMFALYYWAIFALTFVNLAVVLWGPLSRETPIAVPLGAFA